MLVFRSVRIATLVTMTAVLGVAHAASAANFEGIGQHTLTSNNLAFTSSGLNDARWSCGSSIFEVNVAASGASATVTGATFDGCLGMGLLIHGTASGFPWTITRTAASTVTIDGVRVVFNITGFAVVDLTGNLAGGAINCTTHTVTYTNAGGLTATATTIPDVTAAATVNGDLRDDQNTLCVT